MANSKKTELVCTEHQSRIEEFMINAEQELPQFPVIPNAHTRRLRARLILEEAYETIQALGFKIGIQQIPHTELWEPIIVGEGKHCDIVGVVDGCCDVSVVTIGTLSAFGVIDAPLLEAIDESNLAKFEGDAHKDENGKWIKPSDWKAPDILQLLIDQGYQPPEEESEK